jgi:hypothetical protein
MNSVCPVPHTKLLVVPRIGIYSEYFIGGDGWLECNAIVG